MLNLPRQLITNRSAVTAGSAPPSGNHPVFSPFTGSAGPRVPINSGPQSAPAGLLPSQRIGVPIGNPVRSNGGARVISGPAHFPSHYGF